MLRFLKHLMESVAAVLLVIMMIALGAAATVIGWAFHLALIGCVIAVVLVASIHAWINRPQDK